MPRSYPRPRFVREESWRYKRVKEAWRSPRGKTSRVRRSKKGWPPVVKIGYSRPRTIRGMHPSGLREVLVWRPDDLKTVDPKVQVARIAHTVGENKRILIVEEAKKANIRILNPGLKKPPTVEAPAAPEVPPETTEPETTKEPEPEPAKKLKRKAPTTKKRKAKRSTK